MSPPGASAERPPQQFDRAAATAEAAPFPLEDALAELRLWGAFGRDSDHHDQVQVGDTWELCQGLGLVLLTKPSSTLHTPARFVLRFQRQWYCLWVLGVAVSDCVVCATRPRGVRVE